jgi:hypothetical protein
MNVPLFQTAQYNLILDQNRRLNLAQLHIYAPQSATANRVTTGRLTPRELITHLLEV